MTGPLDMSQDPDRFDPSKDLGPVGPLDPAADPDRFVPGHEAGRGLTLTEMLGEGAQEGERDAWSWAFGLAGVLGFLLLFTLLVQLR